MTPLNDVDPEPPAILHADHGLRRRLVLIVTVLGVLGAVLLVWLRSYLEDIMAASEDNPEQAVRQVFNLLRLSTGLTGLGLLGFAFYVGRFSLRVLSEDRYPPSGTKVARDTRVLTGARARLRGRLGLVLAGLVMLLGLLVPWFPDLVVRPMMRRAETNASPEASTPPAPGPQGPPQDAEPELHAGASS